MTSLFKTGGGVILLFGVLTWLLLRSFAPPDPASSQTAHALDLLELNESRLHADVLSARAGLLLNYDPLVRNTDAMRSAAGDLRAFNPASQRAIAAIRASVADQERLVETFKTDNALLQNSLSYFDRLGETAMEPDADPFLKATVGALVGAVAHLSQNPSPEVAQSVQSRIDSLQAQLVTPEIQADVSSLVLRARLLLELLPRIDGTLRTFRDRSTEASRQAVRSAIGMEERTQEREAARFRVGLFAAAVYLAALLILAVLRARAGAAAMRRRTSLEQLIGQASTQFIACPPESISARIDDALRTFGEGTGPDRAYVLRFDKPGIHFWSRQGVTADDEWLGTLKDAVRLLEAVPGQTFRTPDQQAALPSRLRSILAAGRIVAWSCAKLMRGDRMIGALCFDRFTPRPAWLDGAAGLLRMQGDVIANALHRELMMQERQDLEVRLRQGQRLEAIGTFTSGVAHNFNNVIGTVLGHAEMAADAVPSGSVADRHIGQIAQAGERARDIVNQILDFGRRGRAAQFLSAPDTILAETLRQLEPVLGITVVARGSANGALVMAEPAQLQQLMVNLLRNAEQASAPGGSVVIALDRLPIEAPRVLSHGTLDPMSYVRLSVTDHGRGIDAAVSARLFEPFFTTRSAGTGLGLATAHEIVTESGGAFDVHSIPGQGSTFEVWLPEASAMSPETPETDGPGGTVLLVGSDQQMVTSDEEVLAALGYEPVGFSDPVAALAALRRHPDRFDAAIVDRWLVGTSGLDVAAVMHAVQPQVPVLLCLARTDTIRAEQMTAAGVADVVRRPWRSAVVAAVLTRILSAVHVH